MKINKDKLMAGIIAVVTFTAIICELIFGEITTSSVAAAVKDVMSILIDIGVLFVALMIATKKDENVSVGKLLEKSLDNWRYENSNMIVRDSHQDKNGEYYSLGMKTDLRNYFGDVMANKGSGWFLRMPLFDSKEYTEKTFNIQFHLNIGTFLDGIENIDRKRAFENISGEISSYLQIKKKVEVTDVKVRDSDATIYVSVDGLTAEPDNDITVQDRVEELISLIDCVYKCYLVAGHYKLEKEKKNSSEQ